MCWKPRWTAAEVPECKESGTAAKTVVPGLLMSEVATQSDWNSVSVVWRVEILFSMTSPGHLHQMKKLQRTV